MSEGFSAFETTDFPHPFKVKLSIEKDSAAHSTLLLRAFYRQFAKEKLPDDYYACLRNTSEPLEHRLKALFNKHPIAATRAAKEARQATLDEEKKESIHNFV